jgi:hypothetical protein
MEKLSNIERFHINYIVNTEKEVVVKDRKLLICNLTTAVQKAIPGNFDKVYLKSRVLKHIYDKRTAQIYDFMKINLSRIVKYPDIIRKNHSSKRGSYILEKSLDGNLYCVVIEIDEEDSCIQIVTFFPTNKEYLVKFKKIWSWKGGNPHRNTLDAI